MLTADIHLKRLQNNCSVTLERYMDTARATCEMVGTLRKLPVSKDRRMADFHQIKREEEAMAEYRKAARTLLEALEIAPELVDSETPRLGVEGTSRGARVGARRRGVARTGS